MFIPQNTYNYNNYQMLITMKSIFNLIIQTYQLNSSKTHRAGVCFCHSPGKSHPWLQKSMGLSFKRSCWVHHDKLLKRWPKPFCCIYIKNCLCTAVSNIVSLLLTLIQCMINALCMLAYIMYMSLLNVNWYTISLIIASKLWRLAKLDLLVLYKIDVDK